MLLHLCKYWNRFRFPAVTELPSPHKHHLVAELYAWLGWHGMRIIGEDSSKVFINHTLIAVGIWKVGEEKRRLVNSLNLIRKCPSYVLSHPVSFLGPKLLRSYRSLSISSEESSVLSLPVHHQWLYNWSGTYLSPHVLPEIRISLCFLLRIKSDHVLLHANCRNCISKASAPSLEAATGWWSVGCFAELCWWEMNNNNNDTLDQLHYMADKQATTALYSTLSCR